MSSDSSAVDKPKADHRVNGRFVITKKTFSRDRFHVVESPIYQNAKTGSTYKIEYSYYDEKGAECRKYPQWVSPVLSIVYPVTQTENEETGKIEPNSKYGMPLGYRVIQPKTIRAPRAELDDQNRLVKWIDLPREFEIQDAPTGNAWFGDNVQLSEDEKREVIDFYSMIAEAQSEVRAQLARILDNATPPRSLGYSAKLDLIKSSSKTPYQVIRSTVAQGVDKKTQETIRMFTAQLDRAGKKTVELLDFIQFASGARVKSFASMCSVHLSALDNPRVHLTIDRVVVFARGEGPDASSRNLSLENEELFDSAEPMTAMIDEPKTESKKHALEKEEDGEYEKVPRVAESVEDTKDTNVFLM